MKINTVRVAGVSYLQLLERLAHAPKQLYIAGQLPPARVPSVAIIGTRKPTPYGRQVTYDLAYKLAKQGIVIISGLAYGVDAIAHQAALDAGGITIAVLAGGLDKIYPSTHQGLAQKIIDSGGAVISEYPEGTSVHKFRLLARNRLVSGLADGVVVTEAAARSGTLSTINHALDQNKEVFAVPGPITSLQSVRPNLLLQQGAHPVLSAESILEVIAPALLEKQTTLALGDSPAETTVLKLIQSGVRDSQLLQKRSGLSTSEFLQTLTMLELNGHIRSVNGGQWVIV